MKTWEEIIAKALYWKCVDKQRDERLGALMKVMVKDQHLPFFDPCLTHSFINGIELAMGKEVADWLSYLLYEVTDDSEWTVQTVDGKEYDFGKKGEALRFFEENYPLTHPNNT